MVAYRTTLGKRVSLRDVHEYTMECGLLSWLDTRALTLFVKLAVEIDVWATIRLFPTGTAILNVPDMRSERAQVGAFSRCVAFLSDL